VRADIGNLSAPLRLIIMGVSGSGKSTLSMALGERLGLEVMDGDDLHLPESVDKMRAGIALQDADRWPWLDRIGAYLAASGSPGRVVACSALRRAYRDRIRAQAGAVHFVFLEGHFELISQRMARRAGHYMQPQMLESQFRTLERPTADEADVITLPITEPVSQLVDEAIAALPVHPGLSTSL
jgi:gluconokinase